MRADFTAASMSTLGGLGDLGQNFGRRGVAAGEGLAGLGEGASDEAAEAAAVAVEPGVGFGGALGGGAVVHGLEDVADVHRGLRRWFCSGVSTLDGSGK